MTANTRREFGAPRAVDGMISHFVARRTRDYGIRIALGLAPTPLVSQDSRPARQPDGSGDVLREQ